MIVSFCGNPGAGKSTAAKKLADKLGWPYYYIGALRRQIAKEKGLTIEEYNKLGETDPSTDLEIDNYQTELGKKDDNFIIDGRTSWYFIPRSLKIFVDVNEEVGAQRILGSLARGRDRNETNKELKNVAEMVKINQIRKASDDKRYKQYYNIDINDMSNFDFIIDTTHLTPEETFAKLWEKVQEVLALSKKS